MAETTNLLPELVEMIINFYFETPLSPIGTLLRDREYPHQVFGVWEYCICHLHGFSYRLKSMLYTAQQWSNLSPFCVGVERVGEGYVVTKSTSWIE